MSYRSKYTGEQMDALFDRVSRIQTGTVEVIGSTAGLGYADLDTDPGLEGAVALGCVVESPGTAGFVYVNVYYSSEIGHVHIQISGSGVYADTKYLIRWILLT